MYAFIHIDHSGLRFSKKGVFKKNAISPYGGVPNRALVFQIFSPDPSEPCFATLSFRFL